MIDLIIGISGLVFGVALARSTPYELQSGRKYLQYARLLLFMALALTGSLLLAGWWQFIFALAALLLLGVSRKFEYWWAGAYLIILLPYFRYQGPFQLLIPSLLFLYGLPAGSLLWMQLQTRIRLGDGRVKKNGKR